jgi:RHS repeat-associated protein
VASVCAAVGATGLPVASLADAPPPPPHHFAFTTQPGSGDPGIALGTQPVVTVYDSSNQVVSGASVSLALNVVAPLSQPTAPALTCTSTTVSTDSNGKATFAGCKVDRGGQYKLRASVTGVAGTVDSTDFYISGVARLAWTGQPQSDKAGVAWSAQPQITVKDAHDVTLTGNEEIGLVVQPPNSSQAGWSKLACTTNPVTTTNGVAQFAGCKIDTVGNGYTLYAMIVNKIVSPASDSFNMTTGDVAKLAFVVQPATTTGGVNLPAAPKVQAQDAGGNVVSSFTGNVALSITSGTGTSGAALTCTNTTVAAVAGEATFPGCTVDKAGTGYTLTATTSSPSKTVASAAFNVGTGPAASLSFHVKPDDAHPGTAFGTQPEVKIRDAGGNPVNGAVTLSIKSGTGTSGAALTCTVNPQTTTSGKATFTGCAIDKLGAGYELVASSGGLTVDSDGFDVTDGTASALEFDTSPSDSDGGSAFTAQPVVKVLDSGGNAASGSVQLSISPVGGTPDASLTCTEAVSAVSGLATFSDCAVDKAGTGYRLLATLVADSDVTALSEPFKIEVGDADHLAFTTQPGGGTGGEAWDTQPVVTIEDAGGNPVSAASSHIALAVTGGSGDGTLDCQDTTVPTQLGVARFQDCSIDRTGSAYTLTASVVSGDAATGAISDDFEVAAGDPHHLVFSTQPDGAVAGSSFGTQPIVSIVDRGGNVVDSSATITLSITPNTGVDGAGLGCSSASANSGVASFGACSIDTAGGGYTLTATDAADGLSRESHSFPVLLAAPPALEESPVGVPLKQTFGGRLYGANPTATDDRVNSATGALTFSSTDLRVAGIGMPLVFDRTYNSLDTTGGWFGPGWTSLLDMSVRIVKNQTATLRGEDGQQLVWTWDAINSRWVAPPGAYADLVCGAKTCRVTRDDGAQIDLNLTADGTRQIVDYLAPDGFGLKFAWASTAVTITVGGGTSPYTVVGTLSGGRLTRLHTPSRDVYYQYTSSLAKRLAGVTDVTGEQWAYAYESGGRLAQVTDPDGDHQLEVGYGSAGRVNELRSEGGPRHIDDTFGWDASTETATRSALTDAGGDIGRRDYVDVYSDNVLVRQTTPTGAIMRYSYDDKLQLVASQDALGFVTTYAYNSRNLIEQSTPISSTRARTVRMAYDGQHRITAQTDPNGNTTTYVYNGPWLATIRPPSEGNTQWLRFDYNALGLLTRTVGPKHQRLFTYNAHGNQTKVVIQSLSGSPLNGNGTSVQYDEAGNRTKLTDAIGRVTEWTYDEAGRLLTLKSPGNLTTEYDYDRSGELIGGVDPMGNHSLWSWDESALSRTMTFNGDPRTEQTYDASGNLLTDESPETHRGTTYVYDTGSRNVSMTEANGTTTSYDFDLKNNLVAASDTAGRTLFQQFDALNRQIRRVENGRETAFRYDRAGNVVSSTDPAGHVTTFGYNAVNAVTTATNPAGTTTYGYDTMGNLTSVTDPGGHITSFVYDAMGRKTSQTVAGGTTSYSYDAVDRLTQKIDPDGRKQTYTLNVRDQIEKTVYALGNTSFQVKQEYDSLGRRTKLTDADGAVRTFVYDAVTGNLETVTTPAGNFTYDYDEAGKIVETYPDGTVVTYGLDDAQNVMSVEAGTKGTSDYVAASYLRNSMRKTIGLAMSNGLLETRQVDRAGDVLSQTLSVGGQVAATDQFTYDAGGNPVRQVNTVKGTVTTDRFGYDGAGRLDAYSSESDTDPLAWPDVSQLGLDTSNDDAPNNPPTTFAPAFDPIPNPAPATGNGPTQSLTYDADGNRLSNLTGGSTSYAYDAKDQLASRSGADGNATYTYDKSGNLTRRVDGDGTTSYGYNAAGQLTSVALPNGKTISYKYDGDGNRTEKTYDGTTTEYIWDPANPLPQLDIERDKSNPSSDFRRYIYGDGPVAMQTADATFFYHLDPHGSVTELTTENGDLAAAYHYDGWGNVDVDGDGHSNPLRFQATYFDADSGLYYMRARNYDATNGRFTQRDPVAAPVGAPVMSPYAFANDRPTSLSDPTGMVTEDDVFWSHNSDEANIGTQAGYGVSGVKLGVSAYSGYGKLAELLSPKTVTATAEIGSSVGTEASAVSSGVRGVSSEAGALGKLGGAAGEGAAASEALEGSGKALKAVGMGLAIAGIALQTYITVEDCLHDTALVCAADVVGLTISIAFTVGCEFVSGGVATAVCGIAGAALAIFIPMIIKEWGPQIAQGLTTAYNAVADAAVAGWGSAMDAAEVALDWAEDAGKTALGAIVSGYDTAVSALSSGYQTVINTLVDAGYEALELAKTLGDIFETGAKAAISTLVDFGYDVADIAVALAEQFNKTLNETVLLLKDTFNYTVTEIGNAVEAAFDFTMEQFANALKLADYAIDQIANALQNVLDATEAELAEVLDTLEYGIEQITGALQDVYELTIKEIADLYHQLEDTLEYTAAQIAETFTDLYNAGAKAVADALKFAEYAIDVVADVLQDVFDKVAAEAAAILDDIDYLVDEVAGALKDVFDLVNTEVAAVLQGLEKTALEVANALKEVFEDGAQTIANVLEGVGYEIADTAVALADLFVETAQDIATWLNGAGYFLADIADQIGTQFGLVASEVIDTLQDVAGLVLDEIAQAVQQAFELTMADLVTALNAIGETVETIMNVLQDAFNQTVEQVASLFNGLYETLGIAVDALKSAFSTVYGIGEAALGGILEAAGWLADAINDLGGALADFGEDIADAFEDGWDAFTSIF